MYMNLDDDDGIIFIEKITKAEPRDEQEMINYKKSIHLDVGLDEQILRAISLFDWTQLSAMHKRVIQRIIKAENVLEEVEEVTHAILLGLMQRILRFRKEGAQKMVAFIIMPTRDMCAAVLNQALEMKQNMNIVNASAELPFTTIREKLESTDIVISTPSLILAHLEALSTSIHDSVISLVIDQLDVLIAMGYERDLIAIFNHLPKSRLQTVLFVREINNKVIEIESMFTKTMPEEAIGQIESFNGELEFTIDFVKDETENDEQPQPRSSLVQDNSQISNTTTSEAQVETDDDEPNARSTATKNKRPFKCIECDYAAYSRIDLKKHSVVHIGFNRPHKCTLCSASFVRKFNLLQHMKLHQKMKEPEIVVDRQSTLIRTTPAIKRQRRTKSNAHFGEKTFCYVCKKFINRDQFEAHMSTHADEKSTIGIHDGIFKCGQCLATFELLNAYKRHMSRSHDIHQSVIISDDDHVQHSVENELSTLETSHNSPLDNESFLNSRTRRVIKRKKLFDL